MSLWLAGCDTSTPQTAELQSADAVGQVKAVEDNADDNNRGTMLDVHWQWIKTVTPVEEIVADAPERYTLTLMSGGRAEMLFDCNRGSGSYEIDGNGLTLGPMMSTRMACPDGTQDAVYMQYLQRVTTFFLRDGALYLELPVDSGTMEFRQAGKAPEVS
jgi:heat shock protein HslJ